MRAAEELEKESEKNLSGRARRKWRCKYSPKNQIPSISLVDAGTVELIRAPRLQGLKLGGTWYSSSKPRGRPEQLASHRVGRPRDRPHQRSRHFAEAARPRTRGAGVSRKYDLQQWIMGQFRAGGVTGRFAAHRRGRAACGVIRITNRKNEGPRRLREGDLLLLEHLGKKRWHRTASTTILLGRDIWAPRCRKKYCQKFSGSCGDARDAAVSILCGTV